MKNRYNIFRFIILLITIQICLVLGGCPPKPNIDAVKNGDQFKDVIVLAFNRYNVNFGTENLPIVNLVYTLSDGTEKEAKFMLDGYDADKRIGLQLVTLDDKILWEEERKDGNSEAPDLNDAKLIQEQAVKYDYPIIFICVYDYQDEYDGSQIANNRAAVYKELYALVETPELMKWAEDLGYNETLLQKTE